HVPRNAGHSNSDSLNLTVNNVPPQDVNAGDNQTTTEGSTVSFTGSFTDPGVLDTHTFAWSVTDVNGTVLATGDKQAFSYTPLNDGIYARKIVVTDDAGDSAGDWLTQTVQNVASQDVNAGDDQTTTEGTTVAFSGSFTDPGVLDTHTFAWSVTDVNGTVLATGDKQAFSYTPLNDGI